MSKKFSFVRGSLRVSLTMKSGNEKVGPIPVSTTTMATCPPECAMRRECYAKMGPLQIHWWKVSDGTRGVEWNEFCAQISALPTDQVWRHNQAGDLPGEGNKIDVKALTALVKANKGRRGFTYTHKPMTTKAASTAIARANANGFTINLSADNLAEADAKADLDIAPVVVVLPSTQLTNTTTPNGRRVVICPAYTHGVTCADCQLCQRQTRAIVGFPAHGKMAGRVDKRIALQMA